MEFPELEGTHKDLQKIPKNPRLCLGTFSKRSWSSGMLWCCWLSWFDINLSSWWIMIAVNYEWWAAGLGADPSFPDLSRIWCWWMPGMGFLGKLGWGDANPGMGSGFFFGMQQSWDGSRGFWAGMGMLLGAAGMGSLICFPNKPGSNQSQQFPAVLRWFHRNKMQKWGKKYYFSSLKITLKPFIFPIFWLGWFSKESSAGLAVSH